jgi:hypothetical protein
MLRSAQWQLRTPWTIHRLRTAIPSRRGFAAVTDLSSYPKVGEQVHGFTLKRVKQVPELELTAFQLEHDKTGADYLHIARDDTNNVFSIGFKTNPPDDTGVPHILEHTTLCGSEKSVVPVLCLICAKLITVDTPFATPSSRCFRGRSPTS